MRELRRLSRAGRAPEIKYNPFRVVYSPGDLFSPEEIKQHLIMVVDARAAFNSR